MKLLLIEDDRFFSKFYSNKLKEYNIETETAVDGEEGLLKMKTWSPDIVLLDLIMPKKDGFFVLKERQKLASLLKIPVIVLSTLGQEKDLEIVQKLGANDYVNKGFFNFDLVMEKIIRLTNKSKLT